MNTLASATAAPVVVPLVVLVGDGQRATVLPWQLGMRVLLGRGIASPVNKVAQNPTRAAHRLAAVAPLLCRLHRRARSAGRAFAGRGQPNWSFERTSNRLRPLAAAQLQRYAPA